MKKLLLTAVMVLLSFASFAEVEAGWRMGIRANVGASNVLGQDNEFSVSYGAGCVVEINFNEHLFLQSGIGFDMLSHKEQSVDGNINSLYLDLPVNVGYRANMGSEYSFFIQVGPTLGCGVWGTTLILKRPDGGPYSGNYFDLMKRFDVGVGGRLGCEFSNFQISVGATYGVIPVTSGYNNFNVNFGFAYMFNL